MKSIFKGVLSMCLACAVCVSVTAVTNTKTAEGATGYYSQITATSGTKLLGQLHDLITTTHIKYTSYADCKDVSIVMQTDKGSATNTLMEFYTQEDISSTWDGTRAGTWNREHLWCKSLSEGLWKDVSNSTRSGGTDLHHIRPAEYQLNSTRGNKLYGEVENGTEAYSLGLSGQKQYLGGYTNGNVFEPLDKVKGDVARIVLYVYVHYNTYANVYGSTNGSGQKSCFGTLKFTDVISTKNEEAAISLLLKWNESDPVDSIETTRNDVIYGIQGNRNPFIDHPEYANAIWGKGSVEPEKPENSKTENFKDAVDRIVKTGVLAKRLQSINSAIEIYETLSETDKAEVAEEIIALKSAIDEYN
ncbi:MAG: endonuclease, partial [Clostridia bacterium]|nr:endonuclease [Clostridia bacterium]